LVSKSKAKEYDAKIQQALIGLNWVSDDNATPRNIRQTARDAIVALQGTHLSMAVNAATAVSLLESILQDLNMPSYTRVNLWNVISLIEAIKD
jgi:uncharacterized protein (UPF0147 family)